VATAQNSGKSVTPAARYNMYAKILTTEVRYVIKDILKYDYYMKGEQRKGLLILLNTILEQNYLQFEDQIL
jgi:hypothetical protein